MLKGLERETGIEPATNGLGSRDSTTELLPLKKRLRDPTLPLGISPAGSDAPKTAHVTPAQRVVSKV